MDIFCQIVTDFSKTILDHMSFDATKPLFGVSDKARLKLVSSATETRKKIEISPVASFHMILSKKLITKTLIRLCGCATDLRLWCSQTLKTGFHASRPILYPLDGRFLQYKKG